MTFDPALALSEIDHHFGRFIIDLERRIEPTSGQESVARADAESIGLAAALTSKAVGQGHVCLTLEALARRTGPSARLWRQWLRASPLVATPGQRRPLVLDSGDRLYLFRQWQYEEQLRRGIVARLQLPPPKLDELRFMETMQRLFSGAAELRDDEVDWQAVAAAVALSGRFTALSGGPGTGKTTTVAKILLLAAALQPGLRLALAAPTGKAAARLQEALRGTLRRISESTTIDAESERVLTQSATTLHRLLGSRRDSIQFHHGPTNPLRLDLLVVDEASMVDLALMAKLVRALPNECRLILVGDKDQLASVEAGAVWADICGRAPGLGRESAARLSRLMGRALPHADQVALPDSGIADRVVQLRRSYRFNIDSGIGQLAQQVNQGAGEASWELLTGGRFNDLEWLANREGVIERILSGFGPYLEAIDRALTDSSPSPLEPLFQQLDAYRVLCVHRQGATGVETVNRVVSRRLGRGRLWYPGRAVMVNQNDYDLRLYNGDVGIAWERDGELRVHFLDPAGGLRSVAPARLPSHEEAFAMTVHKSQGSEMDTLLLLLPDEPSPILSRETLYTAITRARKRLAVIASPEVWRPAVERPLERASGLRAALWGEPDR